MEKMEKIKEWLAEKTAIIQAEKESLAGLPEAEKRPEELLLTAQQALLDELAKIVEE